MCGLFLLYFLSQIDQDVIWEVVASCDIQYGSPFIELLCFAKGKFEHSFDVVAVGCKFMFQWVVGKVVDFSVGCHGFSENVYFKVGGFSGNCKVDPTYTSLEETSQVSPVLQYTQCNAATHRLPTYHNNSYVPFQYD